MQERRNKKIYVDVTARFTCDGSLRPLSIQWEDGRIFDIDRILDARPAASLKAGGAGIRYKIVVKGRETFLFLEENRWFVEGRD